MIDDKDNLLKHALETIEAMEAKIKQLRQCSNEPIAVVGMGCRFPGNVNSPDDYKRLLENGIDAIIDIPKNRWPVEEFYDSDPDKLGKMYSLKGGWLNNVTDFDAQFFGISANEAISLDPQQRLLLEVSWEALENAGIVPSTLKQSKTGVFVGISQNDYTHYELLSNNLEEIEQYSASGNGHSFAAGRLSYLLGLQGPCAALDTACSSSLVAIHLACQSLRLGESNLALAGGVQLMLSPVTSIAVSRTKALSLQGKCRTFSANADGFVRSEGSGILILKRLSDAIKDGDQILASILSSVTNHDGSSSGLMAPNGQAQQNLIQTALRNCNMDPLDVTYLETHGTGTVLGDPIEVEALANSLCVNRTQDNLLHIGSVKTNIGHLEAAAGVASVIKTILSIQHRKIFPNLHFDTPNSHIDWTLPIKVPTETLPWETNHDKYIAGVSSFGLNGTNAHLILGNFQLDENVNSVALPTEIVTLSAKQESALNETVSKFIGYLDNHPTAKLENIAYTTNTTRTHFQHRLAFIVNNVDELKKNLLSYQSKSQSKGCCSRNILNNKNTDVVFLFTGQGSQYIDMAKELYETSTYFKNIIDDCSEILLPWLNQPISNLIYNSQKNEAIINETKYAQPILFSFGYALYKLWEYWGINPVAVIGHSLGEYIASCVASVFSLEEGLKLVAERGRLMQALPQEGEMWSIFAPLNIVREIIAPYQSSVAIAAINGPNHCVISGLTSAIKAILSVIEEQKFVTTQLHVSHAFHSPLMQPMLSQFEKVANSIEFKGPRIPIISNITGQWASDEIATPEYWIKHIRAPVNFNDGINTLSKAGYKLFLEIGSKPTLSALGSQCIPNKDVKWLPTLKPNINNWRSIYTSLGELYISGVKINWTGLYKHIPRNKISLPTYSFQRKLYWKKSNISVSRQINNTQANNTEKSIHEYNKQIYTVEWIEKPSQLQSLNRSNSKHYSHEIDFVFMDTKGLGENIVQLQKKHTDSCIQVYQGESFKKLLKDIYTIRYNSLNDLNKLLDASISKTKNIHYNFIYLWPLELSIKDLSDFSARSLGCINLVNLVKLIHGKTINAKLRIITSKAVSIDNKDKPTGFVQSALWGVAKALALEYPQIVRGAIDLDDEANYQILQNELHYNEKDLWVAYRHKKRYAQKVRAYENFRPNDKYIFSQNACYLITGGAGTLGLHTLLSIVAEGAKHIYLCSRNAEARLKNSTFLSDMTKQGVNIQVLDVDVANEAMVMELFKKIGESGFELKGIIHAAGISGFQLLPEITEDKINDVLRPKVSGGFNLHKHSQTFNLDFFISFSSISSVWGSKGQIHYAAANHFLDSLMHYRKSVNLPGLTVNWGPWSGSGMVNNETAALLNQIGINTLESDALTLLIRLLSDKEHAQYLIANIEVNKLKSVFDARTSHAFFDIIESKNVALGNTDCTKLDLNELVKQPYNERVDIISEYIAMEVQKLLGYDMPLDRSLGLIEMGLDSLSAVELKNTLEHLFNKDLPTTLAFDFPDIESIAAFLANEENISSLTRENTHAASPRTIEDEDIAVVSLACRFPGDSNTLPDFWKVLVEKIDTVTEIEQGRWDTTPINDKVFLKQGGFLTKIEYFDAKFFGISPKEALSMDPQQRLLLEVCWETLENAGFVPDRKRGDKTGVYIGISQNDYVKLIEYNQHTIENGINAYYATGNSLNVAAGRISYLLGLNGPSLAIDTACSSSLIALHLACQALKQHECDYALAGGVNLMSTPANSLAISHADILSPTGKCKTFDNSADGYVRGEGCGMILLKRKSEAIKAGDQIWGYIKSSVVNQNGFSSGLTVPSGTAQQKLIQAALRQANISSNEVDYIEAHGTGTSLGDPIEINALTSVFGDNNIRKKPLFVGSVKTNIGHLESAAGIAGIIKILLSFRYNQIPPNLHYHEPNSQIAWKDTPITIPTKAIPWLAEDKPKIAGISSFGFSGTNAHFILEEAYKNSAITQPSSESYRLLAVSAKTPGALRDLMQIYLLFLQKYPNIDINDFCYSANTGRKFFNYRKCFVISSNQSLIEKLNQSILNNTSYEAYDVVDLDQKKQKNCDTCHLNNPCLQDYINACNSNSLCLNDSIKLVSLLNESNIHSSDKIMKSTLQYIGMFYESGSRIDWDQLESYFTGERILIPNYPFQRERYWITDSLNYTDIKGVSQENNFYQIKYVEKENAYQIKETTETPGVIVIFIDDAGIGDFIAENMSLDNNTVIRVKRGDVFRAISDNEYCIEPTNYSDMEYLCKYLSQKYGKISHVVYFWGLNTSDDFLDERQIEKSLDVVTLSVAYLLRALQNNILLDKIWLTLILQGCQSISQEPISINGVIQSCLWSMTNIIAKEFPNTHCSSIDLPKICNEAILTNLAKSIEKNSALEQEVWRENKVYVPNISNYNINDMRTDSNYNLDPNGTYLITGGLGGLGLEIAAWMAGMGAKHIVLSGRNTQLNSHQREVLKRLNAQCVDVKIIKADIANYDDAYKLFHTIKHDCPELKGIIHAAGTIKDTLLINQNKESFSSVLKPKIQGTWNLHLLSLNHMLDFFICFSSIATNFGTLGQGNYAAANGFMDSFMSYRQSLGLPCLSINWGPWKDVGMTSRMTEKEKQHISARGVLPISIDSGLSSLRSLLKLKTNKPVIVANLSENRKNELINSSNASINKQYTTNYKSNSKYVSEFKAAKDNKTEKSALVNYLKAIISDATRLNENEIDIRQPINQLGFDSLMGVNVIHELHLNLGIDIEPTVFMQEISVEQLSLFLLKKWQATKEVKETYYD